MSTMDSAESSMYSGDLLRVQEEVSIGSDSPRPATDLLPCPLSARLGPDGLVVVEEVGEMVLDQILP